MATKGANRLMSQVSSSVLGGPSYRGANRWEDLPIEEINKRTFENLESRAEEGASGGDRTVAHDARSMYYRTLYDTIDARCVKPSPMQGYSVDQESVVALAELIRTSKNTTPVIVRETNTPGEYELVDGERRTRAHMLLGETVGEEWYVLPARVFRVGDLSDEDAEYLLHAENIGQRAMTPSERANGIRIITNRIIEERKARGDKRPEGSIKEELARQLGISPRSAQADITISRGLTGEAMKLYDEGGLTKNGAEAVARLDEARQIAIVEKVRSGELPKDEVNKFVKMGGKPKTSTQKDIDALVKEAINSMRKAAKQASDSGTSADRVSLARLRELIDAVDPDRA